VSGGKPAPIRAASIRPACGFTVTVGSKATYAALFRLGHCGVFASSLIKRANDQTYATRICWALMPVCTQKTALCRLPCPISKRR